MKKSDKLDILSIEMFRKLAVICVFLLPYMVYLSALCPTVYVGDSGELVASAYTMGIAHPPGYSLYAVLGKIFIILVPLANIAYRINLITALLASLTVLLLYLLIIRLSVCGVRGSEYASHKPQTAYLVSFIAFSISLCFAFSKTFWSQAVDAEVYTLNMLLVILTFYLLMQWKEQIDAGKFHITRHFYLFSFIYGLSFTHHPTMIPLGLIYAVFIFINIKKISNKEFLTKAVLLFVIGFSIYLYLPIRSLANPLMDWGNPETFKNTFEHIFRRQYGKISKIPRSLPLFISQLKTYFELMFSQFTPYLLIFIPLGIYSLIKSYSKYILAVTISIFLVFGVALTYVLNFSLTPLEIDVVKVFFIPSYLMLLLWMFFGLKFIFEKLYLFKKLAVVSIVVVLICPVFPLQANYYENNLSRNYIAYDCSMNILRTVNNNGMIFVIGDDVMFPLAYLIKVEQMRPDILPYDDLGCVFENIYGDDFLKIPQINRDQERNEVQRRIVSVAAREVYHVIGTNLANISSIPTDTIGVLYKVIQGKWNETKITEKNPWLLYEKRGIDSLMYKDYLIRDIIAQYYFFMGEYYYKQSNLDKAFNEYSKASKIGTDIDWVKNNLSVIYNLRKFTDKAIEEAFKAIDFNPKNADAYNNLGIAYSDKGDLDKAIEAFKKAISIEPNHTRACNNLANAYSNRGNIEEAIKFYKTAIAYDPLYTEAYANLGIAYFKLKRMDEAIAMFNKSLELHPNYPDAYCNLGVAYEGKGDLNGAENAYKKALSIAPNHVTAHFNLGVIYYRQNNYKGAIREWQEVLRIDPNHPTARKNIEQARGQIKD